MIGNCYPNKAGLLNLYYNEKHEDPLIKRAVYNIKIGKNFKIHYGNALQFSTAYKREIKELVQIE